MILTFYRSIPELGMAYPIANLDSKQPDKVLFDRAEEAMKHSKYDVARLSLQTLINTYPDSEYVARAKLAIGDSWYNEGGAAAFARTLLFAQLAPSSIGCVGADSGLSAA